jgi:LmbE family N-acetylglucosaminyl deacetylase
MSDLTPHHRIMVVVAHPDDMEFGAGGTVARLAREGKEIVLVQCTSGDKGTNRLDLTPEELARERENEEREACRRLGVSEIVFLRLPDGELMPDLAFRERIVRQIRAYRPDIVITHDPFRPYALHPDHRAVGITTIDAVYPTARDPLYFPSISLRGWNRTKSLNFGFSALNIPISTSISARRSISRSPRSLPTRARSTISRSSPSASASVPPRSVPNAGCLTRKRSR